MPVFTAALFTRAKIIKGTKCPSIEGQMKMWCVIHIHTHNQYCLGIKKNELSPFVTTLMDLEDILNGLFTSGFTLCESVLHTSASVIS